MPPTLIDTHAHLDDARFTADLADVLSRAENVGLERIITIGVDVATSQAAVRLANHHAIIVAAVGIQPNHVAEIAPGDWEEILRLSTDPRVVAIGETGLDRYWDHAPFPLQQEYFAKHLELVRAVGKPVIIHCREAEPDVVEQLRTEFDAHGPVRGVMHSYSGDYATVQACLAMGLHVSFAGMVTYKNAEELRRVAKDVPLDRLLVETDSPYLAPVPNRGKRNEPANVIHTAECLAKIHAVPLDVIAEQTTTNARKLFGLTDLGITQFTKARHV